MCKEYKEKKYCSTEEEILLAHCTSDEVCEEFEKQMPDIAKIIKVGKEYSI